MKTILDGLAVEYEDSGQGPAILFLHGWKTDLHTFDSLALLIAQGRRVLKLDLPGFGGTETPSTPWNVGDYASFVANFLKKVGAIDYSIIGHSFGCRIAIKGVATGKLSPRRLVLIGAAGIAHSRSARNRLFTIVTKIGKTALSVIPAPGLKAVLRKRVYEKARSDYLTAGALRETYVKIVGEDLSKAATLIDVPTLLIYGSEDDQTPIREAKAYERLIKGSRLMSLEGRGHFVHQEEPEKVAQLINDFI